MGVDEVAYHEATVLGRDDDHPGQALDYYRSRGETPLRCGGAGAASLGLRGEVTVERYERAFGPGGFRDPSAGERLVATRRPGFELVVGAHKRGDVQALLAGIDRSPGTVRLVRQHLSSVLQAAVDDGLLVRNPARGVKVAASTSGELVPPTTHQVQALYDAAPDWFRVAIVLGAGLGLRQAEASGLTTDRIDWLRDRSVRIDRQWRTKARPWAFAPPKSEASTRTIPAAATVLAELGAHVGPRRDGFVLSIDTAGAEAVDHNRFGVAWRRTMKAAELEGFRFHGLRHYFASSLISTGCSVKAVQHALVTRRRRSLWTPTGTSGPATRTGSVRRWTQHSGRLKTH